MKLHRSGRRGFSLVELLAVVLVLAVLAAVAIPLYLNTRRTSAARACKANLAAIGSAMSAMALRTGTYPTTTTATLGIKELVGRTEGLSSEPSCPLDRDPYTYVCAAGTAAADLDCPNAAAHVTVMTGSTAADWEKNFPAPSVDTAIDP